MKYYVCNHKANLSKEEYQDLLRSLKDLMSEYEVIICPSSCYLGMDFPFHKMSLGSQDVSKSENGPHTGEVTASQLKSLGVGYTLVGHSERRLELKETSFEFIPKINCLLKNDITPIFCIGESENVQKKEKTRDILRQQITQVYDSLEKEDREKIIIAYEPIWAIGTKVVPSNLEICNVVEDILKFVKDKYGIKPVVLYGGSVNEENISELKKITMLDGFLLGSVSLNKDSLTKILTKDE